MKTYNNKHGARKILKEEDYQAALSDIITRDYFPEVDALKRQVDQQQQRCITDSSHGKFQMQQTFRLQEDNQHASVLDVRGTELPTSRHMESLSAFHDRVTSEDNASFDQVQTEEVRRNAKIAALCNAPARTEKRPLLTLRSSSHAMSPLPLASNQFDPPSHQLSISAYQRESNNAFFFAPEDCRTAGRPTLAITSSSNASKSPFVQTMPPPANRGDTSTTKIVSQKQIVPSATRFPSREITPKSALSNWDLESQSDLCSSTDDGSEFTDFDRSPGFPLHVERDQAIKKCNSELNKLVRMTPLIVPGSRGAEESSPLITWGTVDSTPLVVPQQDVHASPVFQLPQTSARDEAATKAHERLARRSATSHQRNSVLPALRASIQRDKSSAGQKCRPVSARSSKSLGSALRKSYLRAPGSAQRGSSSNVMIPASTDTAYRLTPRLPRKLG
ncbi:hypothetical protein FisN_1Hu182 [Fistulifera solaris]|uniref:Uncharacterized protein n=1 Tax=Fistulifera solaris TaxID=1519565 RepID=A0A1Z5JER5_FISSO|nr:hypothetical protein FisN_1Hu182 [Fistulifera solaris]|eukprot:GAX12251.1 hypothetical protein FisN_1Hu182 [Fistulifera solaris]